MSTTMQSDSILVARAKSGDPDAISSIYEKYAARIYKYIYYRVGDAQLAEDLRADIFVRMIEGMPNYEDRGWPLSAWLFRITRDRIVDTLRRQKRYKFVPLDECQDNDDSLENVTEDRLTSETIQTLMNDLTPEQRQVIHMRFHLEMPIEAVARELDRTPGSIKALQYRGIRAISEQMMQEPPARRAVVA